MTTKQGVAGRPTTTTLEWFSPTIRRTKRVTVTLPADYEATPRPCGVLYLLHGYGGNRSTWLDKTWLLEHASGMRLIIVMPESGRRWFINDHEGYRYEDYLLNEVVPAIDGRFKTIPNRLGRAIGGFSMGGAAALFLALRRPEIFSVILSHAGAFEAPRRLGDPYAAHRKNRELLMPTVRDHERVWGRPGSSTRHKYDPRELLRRADRSLPVAVYADVGNDDYDRMVNMNRNLHRLLAEEAVEHEYNELPGGHDWDYVDRALPWSLSFLRQHSPDREDSKPNKRSLRSAAS